MDVATVCRCQRLSSALLSIFSISYWGCPTGGDSPPFTDNKSDWRYGISRYRPNVYKAGAKQFMKTAAEDHSLSTGGVSAARRFLNSTMDINGQWSRIYFHRSTHPPRKSVQWSLDSEMLGPMPQLERPPVDRVVTAALAESVRPPDCRTAWTTASLEESFNTRWVCRRCRLDGAGHYRCHLRLLWKCSEPPEPDQHGRRWSRNSCVWSAEPRNHVQQSSVLTRLQAGARCRYDKFVMDYRRAVRFRRKKHCGDFRGMCVSPRVICCCYFR